MLAALDKGWRAYLGLGFRKGPGRTVLARRERLGPLAVQRALYPEGEVCHVYVLHPPGGVVGGDALAIHCEVDAGARALLTAPGAAKFYRSAGEDAGLDVTLRVGPGASLEWLPHENIYFPGARVASRTKVELAGDARLALWDLHCLGRPAIAERFDAGQVDIGLEICRDGEPLLLERLRHRPPVDRLSLLAGAPVFGSMVLSNCDAAGLDRARHVLQLSGGDEMGATLLEDLLVVRYVGHSTALAQRVFRRVWADLREPLFGLAPHAPRIWAT